MDDLDLALEAARRGGAVVARRFGGPTEAELKARFNPVTAADREAEAEIVGLIRTERPNDSILAEEGSGTAAGGRRWIVDPLDGTVNFVHGIPHIGVSVALYEGTTPLVAVALDPLRDEVFTAASGSGAMLDGSPIRVSATRDPSLAVIATGFPYDHDRHAERYAATLGAVLARVNGIRRMGSAVLDLAWVAAGRYDGYWEFGLAPWDSAAGILLVGEAGGTVTDHKGSPSTPYAPSVVAANRALHDELLQTVAATLD